MNVATWLAVPSTVTTTFPLRKWAGKGTLRLVSDNRLASGTGTPPTVTAKGLPLEAPNPLPVNVSWVIKTLPIKVGGEMLAMTGALAGEGLATGDAVTPGDAVTTGEGVTPLARGLGASDGVALVTGGAGVGVEGGFVPAVVVVRGEALGRRCAAPVRLLTGTLQPISSP